MEASALNLAEHGASYLPAAAATDLVSLHSMANGLPKDRAGHRLIGNDTLKSMAGPDGSIGKVASATSGRPMRAVRALFFDKTESKNWSLGWHQDRTICVQERHETGGFGPWTVKNGAVHVAPPFALLEGMVTMRIHLDDVDEGNAPLRIALGSHRLGIVPVSDVDDVARNSPEHVCLATAGDVWIYATPILHASESARTPAHRRVLQIDFSGDELPGKLEWLGI